MTIELTHDEFDTLLLMCGYAAGAAFDKGDRRLCNGFITLANAINRDNPRWIPYQIPPEESQA
jgi:hypothetical protein